MAFDDLSESDLAQAAARVADAALYAARLEATQRLLAGPAIGAGDDPVAALRVLSAGDPREPNYELLLAFEKRWALLVVRILAPVCDPAPAIADARCRGVTVPAIAKALGVSHQAVYARFPAAARKPRM